MKLSDFKPDLQGRVKSIAGDTVILFLKEKKRFHGKLRKSVYKLIYTF